MSSFATWLMAPVVSASTFSSSVRRDWKIVFASRDLALDAHAGAEADEHCAGPGYGGVHEGARADGHEQLVAGFLVLEGVQRLERVVDVVDGCLHEVGLLLQEIEPLLVGLCLLDNLAYLVLVRRCRGHSLTPL